MRYSWCYRTIQTLFHRRITTLQQRQHVIHVKIGPLVHFEVDSMHKFVINVVYTVQSQIRKYKNPLLCGICRYQNHFFILLLFSFVHFMLTQKTAKVRWMVNHLSLKHAIPIGNKWEENENEKKHWTHDNIYYPHFRHNRRTSTFNLSCMHSVIRMCHVYVAYCFFVDNFDDNRKKNEWFLCSFCYI